MELKGDYKHIDFELKMNKRIQGKFKKNTNLNFNNFIEEYNAELEKAKQKYNDDADTKKVNKFAKKGNKSSFMKQVKTMINL